MVTGQYNQTSRRWGAEARGARGFTLVELLTTLAIITVLVAILTPVAMQARNRSRAVTCLSNLKQLGLALTAYSEDWQGCLPRVSGTPFAGSAPTPDLPEGSSATGLREALAGYIGDSRILICGNDHGAPEFGFGAEKGSVHLRAGSSYAFWSGARHGQYGLQINGGRLGALEPAQDCMLLRDCGSGWHGYRSRVGMDLTTTNVANCVFADGHAAASPVLRMAISDRHYACLASNGLAQEGTVFLNGAADDCGVLLSGRRRLVDEGRGFEIALSGSVMSGGVDYNVDRVFRFSADTRLEPAFRQIAGWVDSLVVR
jgi:prepilin-type N-terminal cleavage/methylation domain-containing protein/prepilin-type processing-associated H-X9-DG protein